MAAVLLSLSGGMDSSTLLANILKYGYAVSTVSFIYGSKHNIYELEAARKIAKFYNVNHRVIDLSNIFQYASSNLMKEGGEIPEGHYESENMKLTVVPGRNLIFASVLASIAESESFNKIALAVHSGDHAIYPDCRPGFLRALEKTIYFSSDLKISLIYPYLNKNKTDILRIGFKLGVPYELTRTCYKDQELSCGKCGSCTERIEAFAANGAIDRIKYEVC